MSLFDNLGNNQQQKQPTANQSPMAALNQLRGNPAEFLKQSGYTIPDGMSTPQDIINHLLSSGQVPQSRYTQALQMLRRGR